jgi:hypothetical protein
MSLVDQHLRTIPEHMSSPPVLMDISVAQSNDMKNLEEKNVE